MSKKKQDYSSEFKVKFVFEAMQYPDGITAYCRKNGIPESRFYIWKDTILKKSNDIFKRPSKRESNEINRLKLMLQKKILVLRLFPKCLLK